MTKQYIIEEIYSAITQFAEKLDQIQESDIVQASADGNTDGEGTLMYEIGELIGACNNTSDFIEEHYGITPDFPYTLTSEGREKVKWYIDGMKEKRKEILDAELDTADDTPVPDENDILSDIASSEEFDEDYQRYEYLNTWGVTDSYNADGALRLVRDVDYVKGGEGDNGR